MQYQFLAPAPPAFCLLLHIHTHISISRCVSIFMFMLRPDSLKPLSVRIDSTQSTSLQLLLTDLKPYSSILPSTLTHPILHASTFTHDRCIPPLFARPPCLPTTRWIQMIPVATRMATSETPSMPPPTTIPCWNVMAGQTVIYIQPQRQPGPRRKRRERHQGSCSKSNQF